MTSARFLDEVLRRRGYVPARQVSAPGISADDFRRLEQALGVSLPRDLRDLYEYSARPFLEWTAPDGSLLSPIYGRASSPLPWDEILPHWHFQRELQAEMDKALEDLMPYEVSPEDVFKACNLDPGWIPIAKDTTNCHVMLDTSPGPAGTHGQVFWMSGEDPTKRMLAVSLNDYLTRLARALDAGLLRSEEGDWIDSARGHAIHCPTEAAGF